MSRALWRGGELAAALGCNPPVDPAGRPVDVTGISIDSRTLTAGDLFVALPGDPGPRFAVAARSNRDGHDFLPAAQAAGAAAALISRPDLAPADLPVLVVADPIDGLTQLGAAGRSRLAGPVFAVTGSSGKTTTKTLLAAAAAAQAGAGSLNNYLGVPLSLARLPATAGPAVVEIGMNHPGEIAPLSRIARPQIAVVVNVLDVHSANFDDPDGIRQEKLSITAGLPADGVLVIRHGIRFADFWPGTTLVFGEPETDAWIVALHGEQATVNIAGEVLQVAVPGGGIHRTESVLAALLACHGAGIPVAVAATRLAAIGPPPGRGNVHQVGPVEVVDDSYNANPASMSAALRQLAEHRGVTTAILGEMQELSDSDHAHGGLAAVAAAVDRLFLVGGGMQGLRDRLPDHPALTWFDRVDQLDVTELAATCVAGERLLVKGSNRVFWAADFVPGLVAALRAQGPGDRSPGQ